MKFINNIYSLKKNNKKKWFFEQFKRLNKHHVNNCTEYNKITKSISNNQFNIKDTSEFLFLTARIFKDINLISTKKKNIYKQLTSSGTSQNKKSNIFLDKKNSKKQIDVLIEIVSNFLSTKKRLPMLVLDSRTIIKNKNSLTARGVGFMGFSIFGKDITFALKENMEIDWNVVLEFSNKYKNKDVLVFGLTSVIWKNFLEVALKLKKKIGLNKSILIHGGGWKKLSEENIGNEIFKKSYYKIFGSKLIHNYYGMIEQTGSIFMECEYGYFHTSVYSEIYVRDNNFKLLKNRKKGIIQILSLLPTSYPGHNILSEDIGIIFGEDTCKCGRLGKYFKILGRVKQAEIRGCSDAV